MDNSYRAPSSAYAAKAAHLWTVRTGRRIGAITAVDDQPLDDPIVFVENEIVVGAENPDIVVELVREFGGVVAPVDEVPPPPRGLPCSVRDVALPPPTLRVVFDEPPTGDLRNAAVAASSGMAEAMAALVRHFPDGDVGLNLLSRPGMMPLTNISEGNGFSPVGNGVFDGAARFIEAWQLLDSYRILRTPNDTTLAVIDSGFWIPSQGSPATYQVPPNTQPDFTSWFIGLNLDDTTAGIAAENPDPKFRWHGAAVASAAVAAVNNIRGAAGAGGLAARPVLFRSDTLSSELRGLIYAAAWGIDVVNMSHHYGISVFGVPAKQWNKTLQFAYDNHVVMVASAGNDGIQLSKAPGVTVFPAGDPRVIGVGALGADNVSARSTSNYGVIADIWAPGTAVEVGPDGDNPANSPRSGTSLAAPLVAGTAAMMRAVAPSLTAAQVRQKVLDTAWQGTGRVTKGLDAYSALLSAMENTLPDWRESTSPQVLTRSSATGLGSFGPYGDGFAAARVPGDGDDYFVDIPEYSTFTIDLSWYERLANVTAAVIDQHGETVKMTRGTPSPGERRLSGWVAPGRYTIRVRCDGLTAYRLMVDHQALPLDPDRFEQNDTFDTATRLRFRRTPLDAFQGHGPGTFSLTLHQVEQALDVLPFTPKRRTDADYFVFDAPAKENQLVPWIALTSELPVTVTLFDRNRTEIRRWSRERSVEIYPPESARSYVKVAAAQPTRYSLTIRMLPDVRIDLGDFPTYEVFQEWWLNPQDITFTNPEVRYLVHLTEDDEGSGVPVGETIVLELGDGDRGDVNAELVGVEGSRPAVRDGNLLRVDTSGLAPGGFALRLTKDSADTMATLRVVQPYA